MFTLLCIIAILRTKSFVEVDKDISRLLVAPVIVAFILCLALDISLIKFTFSH